MVQSLQEVIWRPCCTISPWPPGSKTQSLLGDLVHPSVAALNLFFLNLAKGNVITDKNVHRLASSLHIVSLFVSTPGLQVSRLPWKQEGQGLTMKPCQGFSSETDFCNQHSQQLPVCCPVYGLIWETQHGLPSSVCYHVWRKGVTSPKQGHKFCFLRI